MQINSALLAQPIMLGIGLLYREGYFRQVLDSAGPQRKSYSFNDPGSIADTPREKPDGHPDVRLHDTSIEEWGNDPSLPMERG